MAAPSDITILDLSGKWVMNKSLSDDPDRVLELQGVGWLKRKAIALATITLTVKHYTGDDGVERIEISQVITGGFEGTTENRTLDWTARSHEDHVFGPVKGKSRRVALEEIDIDFLKTGWTPDTVQHRVVQAVAESDTAKSGTTWKAVQTWGFEEIKGERRYVRHLDFTGPKGEHIQNRLVYDYIGPA